MKTKVSPTVVGLFVLGALFLGIVALFSLGSFSFITKPERFIVYFDESISGLDLGSPVKFRGVRVGRVSQVNVIYNPLSQNSVVAVLCEFNRDVLTDPQGQPIDLADRAELDQFIDAGLRAQLGVSGLATGLLFVELDLKDPLEYPIARRDLVPAKYAVIPATPSTISEFQATFTQILANVKDVDFARLAEEIQVLVADSRRQINALDTAAISTELTATIMAYRQIAEAPEIPSLLANLDTALVDLSRTLQSIDFHVQPTVKELTATLQQARRSLAALEETTAVATSIISAQNGLGAEASRALHQLGEAARAVGHLADFLERNPNAILSGRVPPP